MRTGGKELALELEEKGYDWLKDGGRGVGAERGLSTLRQAETRN